MQNNIASNMTQIEVLQSDNMTLCTEKEQAIMQNKKKSVINETAVQTTKKKGMKEHACGIFLVNF